MRFVGVVMGVVNSFGVCGLYVQSVITGGCGFVPEGSPKSWSLYYHQVGRKFMKLRIIGMCIYCAHCITKRAHVHLRYDGRLQL